MVQYFIWSTYGPIIQVYFEISTENHFGKILPCIVVCPASGYNHLLSSSSLQMICLQMITPASLLAQRAIIENDLLRMWTRTRMNTHIHGMTSVMTQTVMQTACGSEYVSK